MAQFDAHSLPQAVRSLFELNHYRVEGPLKLHGAEVDLVAYPTDPFGVPIYMEVTIEHVDNDKYGKDVGKLALIGEKEPGAQRMIISSSGFSLPVKERAAATRILTLTYDELFRRFERFEPYVAWCLGDEPYAAELKRLNSIYEEPFFEDQLGKELATAYLNDWLTSTDSARGWLVITGEYGTGKTALTKILQYRWLQRYRTDPKLPIPLRIELRHFVRQFDAKGLIHHFLDNNGLSHVPVNFVYSLIREGRVVLVLDGYDEMAQYLHARERRACLEALAELSSGGAKGILTSRPNYFTETEELQVFEVLYASLKQAHYHLGPDSAALLSREQEVDSLLAQFIDRFERSLRDLSREQTEALIARVLERDPAGRDAVLGVLSRVFRHLDPGDARSLSGKPVIISYLLQVVEGLKKSGETTTGEGLTEAQTYTLIVDQLMMRDFARAPEIAPDDRRRFLQRLALFLSGKGHAVAAEDDLKDLIVKEFKRELGRLSGETRLLRISQYFQDLRSSATLTIAADRTKDAWRFSHNSLREYLVFEHMLNCLKIGELQQEQVPVSEAMRAFARSLTAAQKLTYIQALAAAWKKASGDGGRGQLLCLLFDAALDLFAGGNDARTACLTAIAGSPAALNGVHLARLTLSTEAEPAALKGASFMDSFLEGVDLSGAALSGAHFTGASLESVSLRGAQLDGASFGGAILIDVDFTGAQVRGSDFRSVSPSEISILLKDKTAPSGWRRWDGFDALGYLQYKGADSDSIPQLAVLRHHPKFKIVEKILEKLEEQRIRQRRGLAQRGAAQEDIPFARDFMHFLENNGWIAQGRRDTVEVTDTGRAIVTRFVTGKELVREIVEFLREHSK